MNAYIIGSLWALSVAASSWFFYGAGQDNITAFNVKAEGIVAATREAGQQGAAIAIAKNRPINQTILNEVQREIQTHTVYADCRHTPAGLRGVNEALTGKRAERPGGGELPRVVTPD